jgi:aspartyl-tRNA(Asn)/glutamyl-tRNA(Gln) amidotransferase subunit B
MAVRAGLALNCTIATNNVFARKNYFYPDLPKGYQISQYESPICEYGWIEIAANEGTKHVRIRRAHLEEDAGKSVHVAGTNGSRVDLNRAGTPLLEIVTEPDLRSADEVVAYLKGLRETLIYEGVCDGDMEKGNFRCEPNLSLRPLGQKQFGTKVELKNINSFKFVKDAIEYEIKRQTKVLSEGGKINQETRLWNLDRGETAVMRSKEEAHDYRYFPDPDLVPLKLEKEWIEQVGNNVKGSTVDRRNRLEREFGLSEYSVGVLVDHKDILDYFERSAAEAEKIGWSKLEIGKELVSCITVDFRGLTNKMNNRPGMTGSPTPALFSDPAYEGSWSLTKLIPEKNLIELLDKKMKGEISGPIYKAVLEEMYTTRKTAVEIIEEKGLRQVSDVDAITSIVDNVIVKHPVQVEQFKGGKVQVLGFLVGQVMKESGGKANPGKVNELLKKKLQ